ncbi:MAG: ABC transporter ATP-binding protein [Lachnospiraceae bacterium]|nr:ABC transporter ATP-binding protein [Lachnospiraceae bacterium]
MAKLEHLSKTYGKRVILDDVSLEINPGEAVGILGLNGTGKSTMLNLIAEHFTKSGEISCGLVPQENPLFDELKPIDNIRMWTPLKKAEILERLSSPMLKILGIEDFLDRPAGKMSGGMKKRLSLATVLINHPELLLLDEPFAALDLPAKHDMLDFMATFTKAGGAIIVVSHEEEIFDFCNRVYILSDAKLHDAAELSRKGISYTDILRRGL